MEWRKKKQRRKKGLAATEETWLCCCMCSHRRLLVAALSARSFVSPRLMYVICELRGWLTCRPQNHRNAIVIHSLFICCRCLRRAKSLFFHCGYIFLVLLGRISHSGILGYFSETWIWKSSNARTISLSDEYVYFVVHSFHSQRQKITQQSFDEWELLENFYFGRIFGKVNSSSAERIKTIFFSSSSLLFHHIQQQRNNNIQHTI